MTPNYNNPTSPETAPHRMLDLSMLGRFDFLSRPLDAPAQEPGARHAVLFDQAGLQSLQDVVGHVPLTRRPLYRLLAQPITS